MKEIFKDIKGYEGLYQVSNFGRIKSFHYSKEGKILKTFLDEKDGYVRIRLKKNKNEKSFLVHRLVAKTFLENKNNYPQINHKDENKSNNKINNLEWCDQSYNVTYSSGVGVTQYSKPKMKKIKDWDTAKKAGIELKISPSSITECCRGKRKSIGGFFWAYTKKEAK